MTDNVTSLFDVEEEVETQPEQKQPEIQADDEKAQETQEEKELRWAACADEIRTEASPNEKIEILDIPLINEEICSHYANIVKELRPHWISRGNKTFHTVGASTYNDLIISDGHATYYEVSEEQNPLIQKNFGPLLDIVKTAISKFTGYEVIDLPYAGLIGFHIFGEDVSNNKDGGHIHTDEPFQRLLWIEPFSNPFSFTLALELPDGTGGLDYWEKGAKESTYLPYELGHLYAHSGRFPHRISSSVMPSKEKPRITLQGHGALLLDTNRIGVYF